MSNSVRPHRLQPTRLLHPQDFPGKSTGVGCHCLLLQLHSDTPIQLTAMGEKHHLIRHEDKARTRLRGHTLWTTALLQPDQVGGRGRGDGWVNYSLWGGGGVGGWGLDWRRLSRQQDETGNQNQWWKQTHRQRTPTARKTYRTVLLQILGKKSSMKPQRNRQRILNIN